MVGKWRRVLEALATCVSTTCRHGSGYSLAAVLPALEGRREGGREREGEGGGRKREREKDKERDKETETEEKSIVHVYTVHTCK